MKLLRIVSDWHVYLRLHLLFHAVVVAWICLALAGCFMETPDSSYDSAVEVIDNGYLEKGWIPAWLPRSATNLREVHNIDTNASELAFDVADVRSIKLPNDCESVEYSETVQARIRRRWWPDEQELQESYAFYRCPADHTEHSFVAIKKSGGRVLFWRTYAR